jgi:hypothetical protein
MKSNTYVARDSRKNSSIYYVSIQRMYAVYNLRTCGKWKYLCFPTALLANARKQWAVDGILHTCMLAYRQHGGH